MNSFHEALQRAASNERSLGMTQLRTIRDDLVDHRVRNVQPFYVYSHWYDRHPETLLANQAAKHMSGRGSHQDHHKLHKLMVDSFQDQPEIMHMYNRSRETIAPPLAPRKTGAYDDT